MPRARLEAETPRSRVRPRSHRIRRRRPRRYHGGGLRPPGNRGAGHGGSGGGGGGWNPNDGDAGDSDEPEPAPLPGETPEGTARLGVHLALGAIAALFFVFLVALIVLRSTSPAWPPAGARMPAGLWLSTGLLLASSLVLQRATCPASDAPSPVSLSARLALAALLGSAFLGAQAWIWLGLEHAGRGPDGDLYLALFYAATLVHALHVLGGVVLLLRLVLRAQRSQASAEAVGLAALYWHFMGVVWLFVFAIVWGPL